MRKNSFVWILAVSSLLIGCGGNTETEVIEEVDSTAAADKFEYLAEQFADLRILRYRVPGFEELDLQTKELLYYLYEAANAGKEITYDQNYKHNLCVKRTLENIYRTYSGAREGEDYENFVVYLKRVWFANGIHHHYATKKMIPEFSKEYFKALVAGSEQSGFPLQDNETVDALVEKLTEILFDPTVDMKRVNKDPNADPVAGSANNYYEGVTQVQAEEFYANMKKKDDPEPISYGLNSKLIMTENGLEEKVWKVGGMYTEAIEQVVYWLKKASGVAESEPQKKADLATFDAYSIAWVNDADSKVDVVNGFIEVYGDAIGYRGAYESVVSVRDVEASKRIAAIGDEAQWFEDNSSISDEHKKEKVVGISAKVINVVAESGDASPSTPIGINLPNANWIRSNHGSKSVNLGNIVKAYNEAKKQGGMLEEFAFSEEEIALAKEHGALAGDLHTDMHEVIGHASGKLNDGIGTPKETLKSYSSTLEEARADLVALYYLMDPKLIDLGIMTTLDVGKTEYNSYIRNGMMMQLVRLEEGETIQESHMRNRQLVAKWSYEKGKEENVIERVIKEGKTYMVVRDYEKLKVIFGELLKEIQRIKSEGDYEAGKNLVETYGVQVDPELHKEVLARYEKLGIAPYAGFINPVLKPVMEGDKVIDVLIEYPGDFSEQMMYYAENYSFLPTYN